jgi:hypothetical protein
VLKGRGEQGFEVVDSSCGFHLTLLLLAFHETSDAQSKSLFRNK